LDNKLNWKEHIIKKRKHMDLRHKELYWLLGRSSPLSVGNKLLLYKSLITPIWTYGIELWGCACKSNTAIMQRNQSKTQAIVDAKWYVTNTMIHEDLGIPPVQEVIHDRSREETECDGTRAETRFGFPAKRTSPFISAGVSVQSAPGSRGVRFSGSNAG